MLKRQENTMNLLINKFGKGGKASFTQIYDLIENDKETEHASAMAFMRKLKKADKRGQYLVQLTRTKKKAGKRPNIKTTAKKNANNNVVTPQSKEALALARLILRSVPKGTVQSQRVH